MKRLAAVLVMVTVAALVPAGGAHAADAFVSKMGELLAKAPAEGDWQVKAADLAKWIAEKRTDFLVVDVRPAPPIGPGQQGGKIPGSIYIPYEQILKEENLKRLPKDKKLVLVCVTGQTQNLPVLPLRALGYNALTLKFGMASWIRGYFGAQFMQGAIAGANYPVEP